MAAVAGCTGSDPESEIDPEQRWLQHRRDSVNSGYAAHADGPSDDPSIDWHYEMDDLDGYPAAQPLLDTVLLLNTASGGCHALDPTTGDRLWSDDGNYTRHAPAVSNETVYHVTGGGFRSTAADGGTELLDHRFRYERWSDGPSHPRSPVTATDDTLVAGFGDVVTPDGGRLVAVDTADGTERWSIPVETQIQSAPVVTDDVAIAADRGAAPPGETRDCLAYAVSIDSGEIEWTYEFGRTDEVGVNWLADPVAGDGLVYVPTTNALVALDVSEGEPVWRHDVETAILVSPTLIDEMLIVGLPSGELVALNAETGDVRWRADGGEWVFASVGGGNRIYSIDEDGVVRGWTLDGERVFQLAVSDGLTAPPTIGGGRLYVPSAETLYAIA